MNVAFIIPPAAQGQKPAERTAGCTSVVYPMPNIYELTVAALLEREGHKVDYFMADISQRPFEEYIEKSTACCFLFWSVNLSLEADLAALAIIRRLKGSAPVVFMGPGPTYFTEKMLSDDHCYVVRGEPDLTVAELVKTLESGGDLSAVAGISYRQGDEIKKNPSRPLIKDLDILPFPARHLIEGVSFSNPKLKTRPYTTMVTSRNCPYQCIYCVPSSLTFAREIEYRADHGIKPPISFRTPENVAAEIEMLAAQGYKAIAFVDDNFIWNEQRLAAICEPLKKHGIVWGCQARVDAITDNIARILSESNCQYVDLGVESFDDEILAFVKKKITRQQIIDSIKILNKYKVPVKLNILIGTSPLETKDTIRQTFREARKLNVSQIMFNIVSPFPATEFYKMAKDNGWIAGGEYVPTDVQRNSILQYPHLSSRDMEKILFRSNVRFFLNPVFVFRQLGKFHSFKDFKMAFKALKIKLFG